MDRSKKQHMRDYNTVSKLGSRDEDGAYNPGVESRRPISRFTRIQAFYGSPRRGGQPAILDPEKDRSVDGCNGLATKGFVA
jgi:hypothetical protein